MPNYKQEITYNTLRNLVNYATESCFDIEIIEGVLNDTYIIHNPTKTLSLKGVRSREYIVLYPQFLNAWSNSHHVLMTDSEEDLKPFRN